MKRVCGCMRVIQRVRVLWQPIIYIKWMSMFYVVCFIKLTCHNKITQMCHLSFFHVQLKCTSSEHIRTFHEFMPIIWKHMKADTYMCKLYCDKYVLQYKHFLGCNERFLFLFFSNGLQVIEGNWNSDSSAPLSTQKEQNRVSRKSHLLRFLPAGMLQLHTLKNARMQACTHAHMHMDAHR